MSLTPVIAGGETFGVITRAVVIGISDYQDEGIPDLQFAHKDAEAFAHYLTTAHVGNIAAEDITLITNENATGGQVHKALNNLLDASKANDKVVIYFAGHGDVETVDDKDSGHLLLYDTPANTYQINSLRVNDLKSIVSKLSDEIGVEVILITDACRSGNLAGSDVSGAQATTNSLSQQFASETKILSCGADEYSLEGEQWGGGRGVFSLHLVEGLTGLADKDGDGQVTLRELQRYLEDNVEDAVYPSQQSPEVMGDKRQVINFVDEDALVSLIKSKSSEAGYEEFSSVLEATVDLVRPELAAYRDQFYDALQYGYFIPEDNEAGDFDVGKSASEIYDQMLASGLSENQLKGVKADFIAALQDDAQAAINSYLKAENELITDYGLDKGAHFKYYPNYLDKAAKLLGPDHYLYSQLLAKKFYFEGIYYRLSALNVKDKVTNYNLAETSIKNALLYDERAAYNFTELGLIYTFRHDDRAIEMYEKAIFYSPNWAIPFANIANRFYEKEDFLKAKKWIESAIQKNDKYARAHHIYSNILREIGDNKKSRKVLTDFVDKNGENYHTLLKIGELEYYRGEYETAINFFSRSIQLRPNFGAYTFMGTTYYLLDSLVLAEKNWVEALRINPYSFEVLNNLGWINQINNERIESISYYERALELEPLFINSRFNLGKLYFEEKKFKNAERNFEIIINDIDKLHIDSYLFLAKISLIGGDEEKSIAFVKKAIECGLKDLTKITEDVEFKNIRNTTYFKSLRQELKKE